MSAIHGLVEFCQSVGYESLPSSVVGKAKLLVIDAVGNLVAGRGYPFGNMLTGFVASQGGRPDAALVGSTTKYPLANVILAHSAIAHSLQLDDTHNASCTHTEAAIVPASLAVAESVGATGKDFLLAVVLGVEVTARVGKALNPTTLYARGHHPSSLSVPFGVAAAVGNLLGLSANQMINAFGLAGVQASGLICASEKGATSWYFQYGRAAQSGFYAALLAQAGITGPSDIFEGKGGLASIYGTEVDMGNLASDLGLAWALGGLSIKMHSCLHFGQASCEALLKVLDEQHLSHTDIDTICLHLPSTAFNIIDETQRPTTLLAAQTSPRYLMAVAALERKVMPAQLAPERLVSDRVEQLVERVQVVPDAALDKLFPARWPALVEVTTRDGRKYSCEVKTARGDADNPPSLQEIQAKFLGLIGGMLPEEQAQDFLARVDELELLPDLGPLTPVLQKVTSASRT